MVSFCDHPMSIFHNFFKHILLPNHWANLDETWQGCSLGEALPNLFKRLIPAVTLVAMATKRKKIAKSLKIFSETRWRIAVIFGMWHLLVKLYQDCSYDAPGVKTGPTPGVTSLNHRNKEGKL